MGEVNIQELKKDTIKGVAEPKKVYPKSIGEAIFVKGEAKKYMPLPKVLNSKWGDAVVIPVKSGTSDDTNIVYYMFTFKSGKGNENNNVSSFPYLFTCSNADFEALCAENGDSEDDLEKINFNLTPLTENSLLNRIKASPYLRSLYLKCICLHNSGMPQFVVEDETHTVYSDGDTVYFNKFPGKLFLKAKNLGASYIDELTDYITNVYGDSTLWNHHYILSSSESISGHEEMLFSTNFNASTEELLNSYSNPNYAEGNLGDFTIGNINQAIDTLMSGGFPFWIMPNGLVESMKEGDSVAVDNYYTSVIKGDVKFRDILIHNKKDEYYPINGISPFKLNIVFNPAETFSLLSPKQNDEITLNKRNGWKGTFNVSACYMDNDKVITIGPLNQFRIKRADSEEPYNTTLDISAEEAMQDGGINIEIVYNGYEERDNYVPFDKVTTKTESVKFTYGTNIVNNVKTYLVVKQADLPEEATEVKGLLCRLLKYNEDNNSFYTVISFNRYTGDLLIPKSNIQPDGGSYLSNVYYAIASDDELSQGYSEFDNILTYEELALNEDEKYVIPSEVTETFNNVVIKIKYDDTNPLPSGIITVGCDVYPSKTVAEDGTTFSHINCRTKVTIEEDPQPIFTENSGMREAMRTDSLVDFLVINRLKVDESTRFTNITVSELNNIPQLPSGIFAELKDMVDTSFMQYLTRIKTIPAYAFSGCESITEIVIPDNVEEIEPYAFKGCSSLVSITIPNSVKKIGTGAFMGCSSLETLVIPDSVIDLGSELCVDCTALTTLDLGAGIGELTGNGFEDCDELRHLYLRYDGEYDAEGTFVSKGVDLRYRNGLNLENRICFSKKIQGDGEYADLFTIHVPANLATGYETLGNWRTFFPNATITQIPIQ